MSAREPAATEAGGATAPSVGDRPRLEIRFASEQLRTLIPLLVAIVGVSAFAASRSEQFLTALNFQNLLDQIAVLGVVSVAVTLLMVAGQLDLAVGSGVSLLSVVGAELIQDGRPQIVVILAMLGVGLVIGAITGAVVALTRVQSFILTLGTLSVLLAIAKIISDSTPVLTGLAFADLSIQRFAGIPISAIIFIAACVLAATVLRFTSLGRRAYAIGSNEDASFLAGVPIIRTKIVLWGLAWMLVALAALMFVARQGSGDPTGGAGLELEAITAVVLGGASLTGGRGTALGTFLGVFLLGLISNALNIAAVPTAYEDLVFGGVLIVAVVWAALAELSRRSSAPLHRQVMSALARRHS